jgi:hypothetical protein
MRQILPNALSVVPWLPTPSGDITLCQIEENYEKQDKKTKKGARK